MTKQDYTAMVNEAKQRSFEYYVLSKPTISDAEFDALVNRIEDAEREHPDWTLPDSPTQCVGSDLSGNGRRLVRHRTPMLSCQKAQTTEAVQKWIAATEKKLNTWHLPTTGGYNFAVMWKYDGISCSLVYQNGVLISAATRGDGKNGSDLLPHVKMMDSVPQVLLPYFGHGRKCDFRYEFKGRVEVRGEIVCPVNKLKAMSESYADCRSAASGLCNKNYASSDCKHLVFLPWAAYIDPNISNSEYLLPMPLYFPWNKMEFLRQIGFEQSVAQNCHGFAGVKDFIESAEMVREALAYPVDGLVIRVCNDNDFYAFGYTDHHPKGRIAYKFPPAKTLTTVRRIEISIGATGRRTPVAWFEPVVIGGRTIEKASLGSEDTMRKLGIYEGCRVEVGLSNDVTPKVYKVIEH